MLYHFLFPISPVILSQVRRSGLVRPVYSKHALVRASESQIDLPQILDYSSCIPFEIESNQDGRVIKVAYRTRYKASLNSEKKVDKKVSKKLDLILVINTKDNFVRTVWLNAHDDRHKTLDSSRYVNADPN